MNEKASVAIIGSAVKARNPMSHGAMKTYPQRARRQPSPEKRGWLRGRATLGATIDQLPPASQTACISARMRLDLGVEVETGRGLPLRAVLVEQVERLVVGRHVRLEVGHVGECDALLGHLRVDALGVVRELRPRRNASCFDSTAGMPP